MDGWMEVRCGLFNHQDRAGVRDDRRVCTHGHSEKTPPPQKKPFSEYTQLQRDHSQSWNFSRQLFFPSYQPHPSDRKNGDNRVQKDGREERGAEGRPCSVFFPSTFGKATLTGRNEKTRGMLLCSALMFLPKNIPPLFLLCSPFSSSCETELVVRKKKERERRPSSGL